MGRDTTRGTTDPIEVGIEAFNLAVALGMSPQESLKEALRASVHGAERSFFMAVRDDLLEVAEQLDASDSDIAEDGPAALIMYAMAIDDMMPPELRKEENADGV